MNQFEITRAEQYQLNADKLSTLLDRALIIFGHSNAFVQLSFVSQDQIQKINKKFRQLDTPTDVLSFPQIEVPNAKIEILGDIVVSPEIVKLKNEQTDDVVKHGLLHLLGFDHESDLKKWNEAAKRIDCQY